MPQDENKGKKFFKRIFCPYFSIYVCCLTYFKYRIHARHMYALPLHRKS